MSSRFLYFLWGGLFIVCAGLGFIPEPDGVWKLVRSVLSLLFFLPPGLLLYRSARSSHRPTILLICNLSALSLVLTLVLLIANFFSILVPETLGTILYYILVIVSAPMVSSGIWALSLFLWSCLLIAAFRELRT